MMVTSHAAAGALIGLYARTPTRAASLGAASHLIMDIIPHWGTRERPSFLTVARIDGTTMLTAAAALTLLAPRTHRVRIAAGIAGAVLPDMEKPAAHLLGINIFPRPVTRFLGKIQQGKERSSRIAAETAAAAAATYIAASAISRLHETRHHGTRHHGTRHHGTRHHGTRHHGTRHH